MRITECVRRLCMWIFRSLRLYIWLLLLYSFHFICSFNAVVVVFAVFRLIPIVSFRAKMRNCFWCCCWWFFLLLFLRFTTKRSTLHHIIHEHCTYHRSVSTLLRFYFGTACVALSLTTNSIVFIRLNFVTSFRSDISIWTFSFLLPSARDCSRLHAMWRKERKEWKERKFRI